MKNENKNMWTQKIKKIKNRFTATGFEPLSPFWNCSLGYSVQQIVQQLETERCLDM